MDHSYAERKLTSLVRDLNQYTADEFRRQMARIISGATGQDVPDDCHTLKAERDALAKEVDAANDRNAELIEERDALAVENIELRQRKLIHIGFTNESQVQYVTEDKEEGAFYPNSDHGCYIPVYMLNVHAHRVGPDSKIYCTHLEQGKKIAEIRAEAGRAGFVAGADALEVAQILGSDFDTEKSADEYAATVRQGGE